MDIYQATKYWKIYFFCIYNHYATNLIFSLKISRLMVNSHITHYVTNNSKTTSANLHWLTSLCRYWYLGLQKTYRTSISFSNAFFTVTIEVTKAIPFLWVFGTIFILVTQLLVWAELYIKTISPFFSHFLQKLIHSC